MSAKMEIEISGSGNAAVVIDNIETKIGGLGDKIKSSVSSMAANFASIHFVITDAMQLMGKAFEAIERYAGYAEVKEQLNLMAGQFGTTGDAIVRNMKQVTEGQFSIEQATKSAATALKNSLAPEQIIGLSMAAEKFNDIAGVSVPEAFDRLADAVQKGSAKAAVSIVGKEGLGDAMKQLAKGADDAGKSGAIYEAIMAKTATQMKITAGASQSLGDNIDRLKASWSDLTLKISGIAVTALYGVMGIFYGAAAAATRLAAGVMGAVASFKILSLDFKAAEEAKQTMKDLWGSAGELSAQADAYMKLAGAVQTADKQTKALAVSQEKITAPDSASAPGGKKGSIASLIENKTIKVSLDIDDAVAKVKGFDTLATKAFDSFEQKRTLSIETSTALNNLNEVLRAMKEIEFKLRETGSIFGVSNTPGGALSSMQDNAQEQATRNMKVEYGDARAPRAQNVTINVTTTGKTAKDIDAELAQLWSRKSSKLRQAVVAA